MDVERKVLKTGIINNASRAQHLWALLLAAMKLSLIDISDS
jgi:hypothetical protein